MLRRIKLDDFHLCTSVAVLPPAYNYQLSQQRWKKQRRKKERVVLNEEQKSTKMTRSPIRLEDHVGSPEPPYSIARHIRSALARVVAADKRKKDYGRRIRYKQLQAAGLTVDSSQRDYGSVFVTPLTAQQHEAVLPKSTLHERFPFSHTLQYKCFWGPAETSKENYSECAVSCNIDELGLKQQEKDTIIRVASSYDAKTKTLTLKANSFKELNQNAAHLGDLLQRFMTDIRK